jgi:ribosomal protein S18 acetylase RimI-like enzyme
MNVNIREYTAQDKTFLLEVVNKLHDFVVDLDPIKRLRKMPGYAEQELHELLTTIKKQQGKIFIAEIDDKQVGVIAGFITRQSKINLLSVVPTKLGVISDVYVDETVRGKRIGAQLIEMMEVYLKEEGCDSLWIDIVAFNTKAHAFYKKHGYSDREIGLLKKI